MSITSCQNQAKELLSSIPLATLTDEGFHIDRYSEDPAVYRYFFLTSAWRKITQEEIFSSLDAGIAQRTEVYVDLPFCRKACSFCRFRPIVPTGRQQMKDYCSALKKEIRMAGELYFSRGFTASGLTCGGGTPSFLPDALFLDLVSCIKNELPFEQEFEFSLEATPDDLAGERGKRKLDCFRQAGVSRLSIGLQSFQDSILLDTHRSHSAADNVSAARNARDMGFFGINADIMLGLPGQTVESFLESLQGAVELDFHYIAINPLNFFSPGQYVLLASRSEPQCHELMSDDELRLARAAAHILLEEAGYLTYNSLDYLKKERAGSYHSCYVRHMHRGGNFLGLGHKIASILHPWQYGNYQKLDKYMGALEEGRMPIAAGCFMDEKARASRLLIGLFLLDSRMDYQAFRTQFTPETVKPFDRLMNRLEQHRFITVKDGIYEKTFGCFLLIDEIIRQIYLLAGHPFDAHTLFLGKEQFSEINTECTK